MIVTTINNKQIDRNLCVKINDEYYEKDVDVIKISGRWYRKSNPKIYFNSVDGEYMKITDNTITGIVGVVNGNYEYGRFEKSFENDYKIKTYKGTLNVANKQIFDEIDKVFDSSNGVFMDMIYSVACGYQKSYSDKLSNAYNYTFERLYNSDKLIPIFSSVDNSEFTKDLLGEINRSDKKFDLINKYSFGLEIETCGGLLAQHECVELGLIPLRDGSIRGHEYTTIPMIGEAGVNLLMNQFKLLSERCSIDKECSMHVHFGNFKLTEENLVSLYNVLYIIQDELGQLFHQDIYNTGRYKSSHKDYCKKFKGLVNSIDELYSRLSDGNGTWGGDFYDPHPLDPNKNRKWDNSCRYYFCNLINALFGSGPKTVEFRLHTPTLNYSKAINWLFICMAILEYAENHNVLNVGKSITLEEIIEFSFNGDDNTISVLNDYLSTRKKFNLNNLVRYNDTSGLIDLNTDMDTLYKTPYNG